jgi:hypothetical protein
MKKLQDPVLYESRGSNHTIRCQSTASKVETAGNFSTNEAGYESCRVLSKVSGEVDAESSAEFLVRELLALLRS